MGHPPSVPACALHRFNPDSVCRIRIESVYCVVLHRFDPDSVCRIRIESVYCVSDPDGGYNHIIRIFTFSDGHSATIVRINGSLLYKLQSVKIG